MIEKRPMARLMNQQQGAFHVQTTDDRMPAIDKQLVSEGL